MLPRAEIHFFTDNSIKIAQRSPENEEVVSVKKNMMLNVIEIR